MARIKKKGLEYYPVDVEFVNSRPVRRLVKREGDGAFLVLNFLLSDLYKGEGYYLPVDEGYYEDLSDRLFTQEAEDVRRIVKYAVEQGIFDERMFREQGILTSAEFQRQFLFCTKARDYAFIDEKYCLLTEEEMESLLPKKRKKTEILPENHDLFPKNSEKVYQSTQSKEKQSIAKQTSEKENKEKEPPAETGLKKPVKEWTWEDIDSLEPPADGEKRNFAGLKEELLRFKIPIPEQYAIICKSGYGLIGHPVWKGVAELRGGYGKIHSPAKFLLSYACKPFTP